MAQALTDLISDGVDSATSSTIFSGTSSVRPEPAEVVEPNVATISNTTWKSRLRNQFTEKKPSSRFHGGNSVPTVKGREQSLRQPLSPVPAVKARGRFAFNRGFSVSAALRTM